MSFYFVIVGPNDNPIFELDNSTKSDAKGDEKGHTYQFVAHAALDLVDEAKWQTGNLNLKTVDRFSDLTVTGFVTASPEMRFLLVHDGNFRSTEVIKNFFSDMYELFIKAILNPFYTQSTPITSPNFKKRAQMLAKKLAHT